MIFSQALDSGYLYIGFLWVYFHKGGTLLQDCPVLEWQSERTSNTRQKLCPEEIKAILTPSASASLECWGLITFISVACRVL